jgi:hypothetical protein
MNHKIIRIKRKACTTIRMSFNEEESENDAIIVRVPTYNKIMLGNIKMKRAIIIDITLINNDLFLCGSAIPLKKFPSIFIDPIGV